MAGNEEPRHSQSGFKTILRQNTFLFIQRLGNTLNHAANSSSSLQTAISIEDEEKDFRKDLKGSGCSSGQEIMQCYLLISLFVCVIMIVTGGTNIGNCPADNYLPVWMIIYGCTGVAVGFTVTCLGFPVLLSILFIASFVEIPGAARLYPIFTKVQHINNEGIFYCPQSLYLLSFIIKVNKKVLCGKTHMSDLKTEG
ncbi:unnamed protein product [Brugia pahangi]|uniref:Aa_trans domain-containing protein n=1 Tax=Brugia pahangi TaxID=6280 RepID=A0A0N4TR40_BRUPA|nr:unnamed protein product [Brugia pahangi]